jgi:transcriptional regulator with XRE-family HTH domain
MEFNRIIKLLRKERGITQKQAADDLGISQALLSHYEKGIRECGLDFVVRVADYYGVSCDYLLGRSAQRNGAMLNAEDIPSPESMKDSIYRGSVLPTMNKKIISNSLNVLYAKVGECRNKALVNEVSAYLMLAVYRMFRALYAAEPHNSSSLFRVDERLWRGYTDAAMNAAAARLDATLAGCDFGEDEGLKDTACLAMTTESLGKEFPMHTPSLLNLIKTSENHTEELLAAKQSK